MSARVRRVAVAVLLTVVANVVALLLLVRVHRGADVARGGAVSEARTVSMRVATPEPPPVEPEPLPVPRALMRQSMSMLPVPDLPSAIRAPRIQRPDLDLSRQLVPTPAGGDLGDLVERLLILDVVDEPPRVIKRVLPEYPRRAEFIGITEGRVLVELRVGADGLVENVEVVESDPPGYFEEVSITALRQWVLTPAIFQGRAVSVRARTEIRFELEEM